MGGGDLDVFNLRCFPEDVVDFVLELRWRQLTETLGERVIQQFHDDFPPLVSCQCGRVAGREHGVRRSHVTRRWAGRSRDLRP